MELKRSWTQFKMRTIPFIRSLGPDFYARLVLFIGLSYFVVKIGTNSMDGIVKLK